MGEVVRTSNLHVQGISHPWYGIFISFGLAVHLCGNLLSTWCTCIVDARNQVEPKASEYKEIVDVTDKTTGEKTKQTTARIQLLLSSNFGQ